MDLNYRAVSRFFSELSKAVDKEASGHKDLSVKESDLCDGISKEILILLGDKVDDEGFVYLASSQIAALVNSTRWRVRARVIALARYGVLRVITNWRDDGSKKRMPWRLEINPMVVKILTGGREVRSTERRTVTSYLAGLGINRLYVEEDLQGFEHDCLFGSAEPLEADEVEEDAATRIADLMRDSDERAAAKVEDREYWRRNEDEFLAGAAALWINGQIATTGNRSQPIWYGKASELPKQAREQRNEILKTYRLWGGRITGIALAVFNGLMPELDKKGNVAFKIDKPHQQWSTLDKKPSHFTKHFDSLKNDPIFKRFTTTEYEMTVQGLRPYFKTSFDVQPQDGSSPSSKLGYELGSSGVTVEEVLS